MNYVKCYHCLSESFRKYDEENGFVYVKCTNCGLVYLNPQPNAQAIDIAHKMGVHRGDKTIDVIGNYKKAKVNAYLRILKDFYRLSDLSTSKPQNWLDIGCGYGEFMEALSIFSKKSLYLKGLEPNEIKRKSCQDRGLTVSFEKLAQDSTKYDFISLLNVYSHLPNPSVFIKNLKRNMKTNGEIFLQTGHSCHLSPKNHHKPYYAPDHLSFANRTIVENILEKNGFSILQTKIYRHEQFPTWRTPKKILVELAKILLNRNGHVQNFFPKYPNRNMYIRAKLM